MTGSFERAISPRQSLLTGTSRIKRSVRCSSAIFSSITLMQNSRSSCSRGRNRSPVPYRPSAGTAIPCNRMNSCGICTRMPAPSPVMLSALSAPRCTMFSSTRNPFSTMVCDFSPFRVTTRPTPHASCSLSNE